MAEADAAKTETTAAAKWTWTKVEDGKDCWTAAQAYSTDKCAEADKVADKFPATMKLKGEATVGSDKWTLNGCEEKKVTVKVGEAADAPFEFEPAEGKVTCAKYTNDVWVSMTLSGYSEAEADATTGAKSLAAAVAAGALAVAATQF